MTPYPYKRRLGAWWLALALLALPSAAWAFDFEFRVPVVVENVPRIIDRVAVECSVCTEDGKFLGSYRRFLPSKIYTGAVKLGFWLRKDFDPTTARKWECKLMLYADTDRSKSSHMGERARPPDGEANETTGGERCEL